jgi:putative AdoMet-dependent methyltransferase
MTTQDQFPASEFDSWATNYDQSIQEGTIFPFVGYNLVLQEIVSLSEVSQGQAVLDLGTGTGNLALLFSHLGCHLTCTDFSVAMLARAREKLPEAEQHLHDLRVPLPFVNRQFDAIVSAYVFHHFPLAQKLEICQRLVQEALVPKGSLVIGDISFPSLTALENFKQTTPDWDDEFYWLADETLPALQKIGLTARYSQVSPCAGVYKIHKTE